jgi:hypothetical protein
MTGGKGLKNAVLNCPGLLGRDTVVAYISVHSSALISINQADKKDFLLPEPKTL